MGRKSKSAVDFCLKWARRFLAVAYLLVFVVCAVEVGSAAGNLDGAPANVTFMLGIALVFLAWCFIVLVHELGHAIASWVLGWRVVVFSIRGLTVWPDTWRFRLGARAFPEYSGAVLAVPRKQGDLRLQFVFILLGGAGANFILAFCAALFAAYWREKTFLSTYCEAVAFLSALTGVLNLVPRIWGTNNDGSMVIRTLQSKSLDPQIHEMLVSEEITKGCRPRDWNIRLVQGLRDNIATDEGSGHSGLLLFSRYFDERDLNTARIALDWAEEKLGTSNLRVRLCRGLLLAYGGDGAAAAEILASIKARRIKDTPEYRIVQAVAAWASGDRPGQEDAVRLAHLALARTPFPCVSDFELLEEIEASEPTGSKIGRELMAN
jgi:hypothetical protein